MYVLLLLFLINLGASSREARGEEDQQAHVQGGEVQSEGSDDQRQGEFTLGSTTSLKNHCKQHAQK